MIELSGVGAEDTTKWGVGSITSLMVYIRLEKGGPLSLVDVVSTTFNGGIDGARIRAHRIAEEYMDSAFEVFIAQTKINERRKYDFR